MHDDNPPSVGRRSALVAAAAVAIAPEVAHTAPVDGAAAQMDELFRVHAGPSDPDPDDGRRGFDFFHGRWTVAHRNRKPLDIQAPWQEFTGVAECRPTVGGLVNVDDNILHRPSGMYRASTVRVFDPTKKQWSIYWISEPTPVIDPAPVQGNFNDGVGLFYADDSAEGKSFKVRFKWHRVTPNSARWEQALSTDGGTTWIDNWFMDFTRKA